MNGRGSHKDARLWNVSNNSSYVIVANPNDGMDPHCQGIIYRTWLSSPKGADKNCA